MSNEPIGAAGDEPARLGQESEAAPEIENRDDEPDVARQRDRVAKQDETRAVSGAAV